MIIKLIAFRLINIKGEVQVWQYKAKYCQNIMKMYCLEVPKNLDYFKKFFQLHFLRKPIQKIS